MALFLRRPAALVLPNPLRALAAAFASELLVLPQTVRPLRHSCSHPFPTRSPRALGDRKTMLAARELPYLPVVAHL
jgi:hypothetical protein